jgi:hypothetical protein
MKTKTIILLASCVFLLVDFSLAQQKGAQSGRQSNFSASSASSVTGSQVAAGTGLRLTEASLEGEPGNIYLGETWPKGELVLKDGKTIENYRFRYDVYADQMQFISDKDTLAFAAPSEMLSVTFEGMPFIYSSYECTGMLMKGYFELLVPGEIQLLLKRTVTYHLVEQGEEAVQQKDTYLINETYFLKHGKLPAQKLLCNKRSALDALKDRRKEMDEFLKSSDNKVRTREDLKKIIAYYNGLK